MTPPAVRPFALADLPAAMSLWAETEGLGRGPGDSAAGVSRFLARNPGLSWVAADGDRLVGAILCGHDGRRGQIYRLAVAPSHRRHGVAAALVEASVAGLRAAGIERCLLSVLVDNQSAFRFWTSVGGRVRTDLQMFSIDIARTAESEADKRPGVDRDEAAPAVALAGAPRLETDRLVLRMFRESDFEPFARISADPDVMRYIGPGTPIDRNEAWRNLAAQIGHWALRGYGMLALEEKATGRFVGRAGFFNPEGWPGFEIGWTVARECWGRGYATEAAARLLDYAFASLGREHVISVIQPENAASLRVAEKIGERLERRATLSGADILIYGIDRETWLASRGRVPTIPPPSLSP